MFHRSKCHFCVFYEQKPRKDKHFFATTPHYSVKFSITSAGPCQRRKERINQNFSHRHKKTDRKRQRPLPVGKSPVGVPGFEPGTSCSQSRRANRTALHPECHASRGKSAAKLRKRSDNCIIMGIYFQKRFLHPPKTSAFKPT